MVGDEMKSCQVLSPHYSPAPSLIIHAHVPLPWNAGKHLESDVHTYTPYAGSINFNFHMDKPLLAARLALFWLLLVSCCLLLACLLLSCAISPRHGFMPRAGISNRAKLSCLQDPSSLQLTSSYLLGGMTWKTCDLCILASPSTPGSAPTCPLGRRPFTPG